MNEEETKALKEKIISTRKERHKVTQKDALARWSYEENVISWRFYRRSTLFWIITMNFFFLDKTTIFSRETTRAMPT